MLPPPRWCARRTWPSRMAVEMTGILNECRPRLRCLRAMLKCLRPDAARDLRRRCDPRERRPEERLAERLLCRCCHRQRGFDGPHGFPFRAMHTAPGPAGARPILKRRLAVTSTRQPDDPLLHVLAEVDVRLVHLEVDPGEDVDQPLHLLPVRLGGHLILDLRYSASAFFWSVIASRYRTIASWSAGSDSTSCRTRFRISSVGVRVTGSAP